MAAIIYYQVNATYKDAQGDVVGFGCVCNTKEEAINQQQRYAARKNVHSVSIDKITLGH
jgi:hypothetical protein